MAFKNYNTVDLYFSITRGDLIPDSSGDIASTISDKYRGTLQEVRRRSRWRKSDWPISTMPTANLNDFHGEINTPELSKAIEDRIINANTQDGFINRNDINVQSIPLGIDHLLFVTKISINEKDFITDVLLLSNDRPGGRSIDI